jgi:hypothetical protein
MSPVTRFTIAYGAALTAFCIAARDRRVIAYVVVLAVTAALAHRADRTAHFSDAVTWALSASGLAHLVGGLLPSFQADAAVFYETWLVPGVLKYDQLVHAGVSGVLTVAAWQLVGAWIDEDRCTPRARAGLAAFIALGLGALNEAVEFLSALRFDDAFVGGFANTGWDLVFNAFGVTAAGLWLALSAPVPASTPLSPQPSRR